MTYPVNKDGPTPSLTEKSIDKHAQVWLEATATELHNKVSKMYIVLSVMN